MYSLVLMVALSGGTEVPDHGRHRRARGGCYGACSCACYGGCYGGDYGGCWGGCYGGYGGGYGGCYGGGYGGYGCWGGGVVAYGCTGGDMDTGGYASYSGGYYGRPGRPPERIRNRPRAAGKAANATIILNVPANARLTFDGRPTTSRSTSRVFVTPPLQPDREYRYNVQSQVDRGGRPVTVTRRIAVRAGQVTRESLTFAPTQVARAP